jgi:hypothetical protein
LKNLKNLISNQAIKTSSVLRMTRSPQVGLAAARAQRRRCWAFDRTLLVLVLTLCSRGYTSPQIAGELTRRGLRSPWGCARWHAKQVHRLLKRARQAPQIGLDDARVGILPRLNLPGSNPS